VFFFFFLQRQISHLQAYNVKLTNIKG